MGQENSPGLFVTPLEGVISGLAAGGGEQGDMGSTRHRIPGSGEVSQEVQPETVFY